MKKEIINDYNWDIRKKAYKKLGKFDGYIYPFIVKNKIIPKLSKKELKNP